MADQTRIIMKKFNTVLNILEKQLWQDYEYIGELKPAERKYIMLFIDSKYTLLSERQLDNLINSLSKAGLFDILSYIFENNNFSSHWSYQTGLGNIPMGEGFLESMVEEMYQSVAGPSFYDYSMEPRNNRINDYLDIIKLLVRNNIYTITQDDLDMARIERLDDLLKILKRLRTGKILPNLRQQIKDSYLKKEFNWQLICSKLNKEGKNDLLDLALGLEINNVSRKKMSKMSKMSKRELCKIISSEMYDIVESCEDSNLLGDDLNSLPKWRIFKIKGKCYDIIDLKNILKSGETRNPFTREQLPVVEINKRIFVLEKMLIKGSIEREDLFTSVRDNPIFSQKEYLNQQVVKLFGMFPYMLEPSLIVKANDSEIDFMANKLFTSGSNDILEVRRNEIKTIKDLKGIGKKIAFVDVLVNTDESKLVVLYDAFSYFSKRRSGQDLSDDRFLYMIGDN
jgi:hypothetical protein